MKTTTNEAPGAVWPCLLCGQPVSRVMRRLTGRELRLLWKELLGRDIAPEAWGAISEDRDVTKRRCTACGFTSCDPKLAGGELFYRELRHDKYFDPERPEFSRTLALARKRRTRAILDVGCGDGAFLEMARAIGAETCGLELNQSAANDARGRGLEVHSLSLAELAADGAKSFDLVTMFQVLEHVPDPVETVRSAVALLEPNGCLALSVPNPRGIYRLIPNDPHQWPPHHISEWRIRDFRTLASRSGLILLDAGSDDLEGSWLTHFWRLRGRLTGALGHRQRIRAVAAVELLARIYDRFGLRRFAPRVGNSLYAFFETPSVGTGSSQAVAERGVTLPKSFVERND